MSVVKVMTACLSISAILLFSGCSAKGQQFVEFKKPQENRGMVYVYRPSSFVGSGVHYDIHATNPTTPDFIAGELVNGGYVEMDLPSGESEIWGKTEAKASVTLDVKNGEIYCVKGGVGIGFLVGRPNLEIVDMAKCKVEIVETKKAL
jgi:hypothetical protein